MKQERDQVAIDKETRQRCAENAAEVTPDIACDELKEFVAHYRSSKRQSAMLNKRRALMIDVIIRFVESHKQ